MESLRNAALVSVALEYQMRNVMPAQSQTFECGNSFLEHTSYVLENDCSVFLQSEVDGRFANDRHSMEYSTIKSCDLIMKSNIEVMNCFGLN